MGKKVIVRGKTDGLNKRKFEKEKPVAVCKRFRLGQRFNFHSKHTTKANLII